jgi:prepilin-type N-terminal cleavage/methylation domain-containing protein
MPTNHTNQKYGFTLIEMLVSLALFTIVSTVTVGALLSLIGGNERVTEQQVTLSAAAFALDNMTREIRTGFAYNCNTAASMRTDGGSLLTTVNDCNTSTGNTGLVITEAAARLSTGTGSRIAYYFDRNSLYRRVDGQSEVKLLPDDIRLNMARSRFYVTGTQTLSAAGSNVIQPTVTIIMEVMGTTTVPVVLQTTITQRALDI